MAHLQVDTLVRNGTMQFNCFIGHCLTQPILRHSLNIQDSIYFISTVAKNRTTKEARIVTKILAKNKAPFGFEPLLDQLAILYIISAVYHITSEFNHMSLPAIYRNSIFLVVSFGVCMTGSTHLLKSTFIINSQSLR